MCELNSKTDENTKYIPIIAVTASAMKKDEEKIRALCDGYLKKSVEKADLIAELTRFLKYSVELPVHSDSGRPKSGNEHEGKCETYAFEPGSRERLEHAESVIGVCTTQQ